MKIPLRELLLVCLLVALAVAWWIERARATRLAEQNETLKADFNRALIAELRRGSEPGARTSDNPLNLPRFYGIRAEVQREQAREGGSDSQRSIEDPYSLELIAPPAKTQ
jgi:hypothetical protein